MSTETPAPPPVANFLRDIVGPRTIAAGRIKTSVTRFPPEPNGYLHIGHANPSASTSAWPEEFGGPATCASTTPHPLKEEQEYIDAIPAAT